MICTWSGFHEMGCGHVCTQEGLMTSLISSNLSVKGPLECFFRRSIQHKVVEGPGIIVTEPGFESYLYHK